jgi:hypothetical protein
MVNESWKDIGFQGKNPRTDFRGGGHLSLLCLGYFVEYYNSDFREMARCTKEETDLMWLTAITSINVTHALMVYLYLNQAEVPDHLLKLRAGRS